MSSSLRTLLAAALVAILLASPTSALEKTRVRMVDTDRADVWRGGTSCSLVYYNFCTGWIWVWSGWGPEDRIGVSFTSCCPIGWLTGVNDSWVWFQTEAPPGYGFTGTFDLYDADANMCPTGTPLSSQAFLPAAQWNNVIFGGTPVPDRTFALVITFGAGIGPANPAAIGTDHPAAGPTGPQACGTCYPVDRTNRSFYYGTVASPLCPGSALGDGVCDAQFLWDASVSCAVSVETATWGRLKNLYR